MSNLAFLYVFMGNQLARVLLKTRFREVFLADEVDGGPAHVGLKMPLLLAESSRFDLALNESGLATAIDDAIDRVELLAAYFRDYEAVAMPVHSGSRGIEILFGDTEFHQRMLDLRERSICGIVSVSAPNKE